MSSTRKADGHGNQETLRWMIFTSSKEAFPWISFWQGLVPLFHKQFYIYNPQGVAPSVPTTIGMSVVTLRISRRSPEIKPDTHLITNVPDVLDHYLTVAMNWHDHEQFYHVGVLVMFSRPFNDFNGFLQKKKNGQFTKNTGTSFGFQILLFPTIYKVYTILHTMYRKYTN